MNHLDTPALTSMTDSMAYSSGNYMAHSAYYSSPPMHHSGHHEVDPQPRQEQPARKRPKYTRSKTGCLTCRCDEAKPNCMRCSHGQRDCTWPEGVPARKRASSVKDSPEIGRPSTASSPGISDSSSPSSTRGHTPPQRSPVELSLPRELNLPPLLNSRRPEHSYLPPMNSGDMDRREYSRERARYSPPQDSPLSVSHVAEIPTYPSRYDPYSTHQHVAPSRHLTASSVRSTMGHPSVQQHWSPPPILSPEPYVRSASEFITTTSANLYTLPATSFPDTTEPNVLCYL
ncbi:unnamed protein product [Mycena citricolor]|uniref:Zn(2)-C6 fungal-type domain-containing protein n=1 Tax=Mycena citricolor TaxID=2018698 RepID=A0AAD2K6I9_9AGAR|nr:unnamed protein product [Mycena citricolor]CAK5281801.1 unnamed protein product [Mycena citricolor]